MVVSRFPPRLRSQTYEENVFQDTHSKGSPETLCLPKQSSFVWFFPETTLLSQSAEQASCCSRLPTVWVPARPSRLILKADLVTSYRCPVQPQRSGQDTHLTSPSCSGPQTARMSEKQIM